MPVTIFTKDDQMRANELIHQIELPVSPVFASLVRGELGAPSHSTRRQCSWYARAHCENLDVPFALRWNDQGDASVVVSYHKMEELLATFAYIAPGLEISEKVEPRRVRVC